jgi:hypothetical protein
MISMSSRRPWTPCMRSDVRSQRQGSDVKLTMSPVRKRISGRAALRKVVSTSSPRSPSRTGSPLSRSITSTRIWSSAQCSPSLASHMPALFIDDKAAIEAVRAMTRIFTGRAGGSTHLLSILAGRFLGVQQAPITYEVEGERRIFSIEKIVDGVVTPVDGKDSGEPVVIRNSEYWIAPDIVVAKADKSCMRAFGRNWNFAGRSAEICRLDWGNA